jgi:tRNA (adenine22-N1)-methyltransferase
MKTEPTRLSERLRAVASLVPPGSRVADIGTGHGKLPHWLLAGSHIAHCIATEKTRESGSCLTTLADTHGIDLRFGDGLRVLRPEDRVDVLVLSGLGARSIIDILDDDRGTAWEAGRLVLQPQTEAGRIRRWLVANGRTIVAERMARERGRFYLAIAAESGRARLPPHPTLSAEELLEAGPCLVSSRNPLVRSYWRRHLVRLERILERAPAATEQRRARRQALLAARVLGVLERADSDWRNERRVLL